MHRLPLALATLLSLHLVTIGLKWLFLAGVMPFGQTLAAALVCLAMLALTYFTTLEASALYYLYQEEAKIYALAGFIGVLLGLF